MEEFFGFENMKRWKKAIFILKFMNMRKQSIDKKSNQEIKNEDNKINNFENKKMVKIIKEKNEEVGEVKFNVYISYFKYGKYLFYDINIYDNVILANK